MVRISLTVLLLVGLLMTASCSKRQNLSTTGLQEPVPVKEVTYPQKLFFCYAPVPYIMDNITFWSDTLDLDGFIQGSVADWYTPYKVLAEKSELTTSFNRVCAENGIDRNFCKIALGYGDLPSWSDSEGVSELLERLENICVWIDSVGFYGVAFDSEPYGKSIWDPDRKKHGPITFLQQADLVRDFGANLGAVISRTGLRCMIILEGAYYQHVNHREYATWWAFFQGLMSTSEESVIVGCEDSYNKYSPTSINSYNTTLKKVFNDHFVEQQNYVFAFGAFPLGFYEQRREAATGAIQFYDVQGRLMKDSFHDKSSRYSVESFRQQLKLFAEYSPEWIWIYGHGASWWQLDTTLYRDIWNPSSQVQPVDKQLPLFIEAWRELETSNELNSIEQNNTQ